MNDTYTGAISLSIFGESHGPAVGATLSGLAAGVPVDEAYIAREMDKRRAAGKLSTKRTEPDKVHFLSGVYRGFTTGTAVTLVIENTNTRSEDYAKTQDLLRPGHADWTAHLKYRGFQDARGGGHFSGRLTAPLVAATYGIPEGTVKVLSQHEQDALETELAYRPESEGVMMHTGACASFLGGMRAAARAAAGERLAGVVQTAAVALGAVLSVALGFYEGLTGLSLGTVLAYQLVWCAIIASVPFAKKP